MPKSQLTLRLLAGALLLAAHLPAASSFFNHGDGGPEDYHVEIVASLWRLNSNGFLHNGSTSVDLVNDLGVHQHKRTFDGQFTLKVHRKNRIVFEGRPIMINGRNAIQRDIVYFSETYSVSDTLRSSGEMNYFYGGYHRDWISNSMGRFGTSVGAAYLGLSGNIRGEQSGTNEAGHTPLGIPLVGVDFRIFPIRNRRWLEFEGGVRGLPVGSYGHWAEGNISVGGRLGSFALLAGYRAMFVDFHQTGSNPDGINLRFKGPVLSLLWSQ